MKRCAGIAQLVEQLICNQQVAGSSPVASSRNTGNRVNSAHVAQLVEHSLGKGEVTGSIPVAGSSEDVIRQGCYREFFMAKNRTIIHFKCSECKTLNYSQNVSKKRSFEKLVLSKYCSKCRKHNEHKETK